MDVLGPALYLQGLDWVMGEVGFLFTIWWVEDAV